MILSIIIIAYGLIYYRKIATQASYGMIPLFAVALYHYFYLETKRQFALGGITITPDDIVFLLLTIAGFQRIEEIQAKFRVSPEAKMLFGVYAWAILIVPFYILFMSADIQGSINTARTFFLFFPTLLYMYSFKYGKEEKEALYKVFRAYFVILCLYTIYRFIFKGIDRPVVSGGAFILLVGFLYFWINNIKYNRAFDAVFAIVCLILVVLLRHRSVWVATAASIVYMIIYIGFKPYMLRIVVIIPIVVLLGLQIVPERQKVIWSNMLVRSASDLTDRREFDSGTGGGRILRWKSLVKKLYRPSVLIIGRGHDFDRRTKFKRKSDGVIFYSHVSFHNNYLEHMFRMGAVSVIVLVVALIMLILRINRIESSNDRYDYLFIGAVIVATMLYGSAYSFTWFSFLIIGMGLSMLDTKNPEFSDE